MTVYMGDLLLSYGDELQHTVFKVKNVVVKRVPHVAGIQNVEALYLFIKCYTSIMQCEII